ncbi:hypothetical protein Tco_0904229 [Tanacetum coccineum]
MLVERRYPLSKELLQRILDLGLEVEEESTAALHLNYQKEQTLYKLKVKIYSVNGPTVDRVMRPLALKQTRKPRSDHGKAHHSVSSTSAHHNRRSSSRQGDDDEDDDVSRSSTPSPTTYLNSLMPLDYQRYDIPTSSKQDDDLLFERRTELLNQTQQSHEEVRGGFKLFGKALRGIFRKKKK